MNKGIISSHGDLYKHVDSMYEQDINIWKDSLFSNEIVSHIKTLSKYAPFNVVYELGCGRGEMLHHLVNKLGDINTIGVGFDISATALQFAKYNYPNYIFKQVDLVNDTLNKDDITGKKLFFIRGVLWYLFDKIDTCIINIASIMGEGELLYIAQPFTSANFVNGDVPSTETFLSYFNKYFDTVEVTKIDNWYGFVLKRNGVL